MLRRYLTPLRLQHAIAMVEVHRVRRYWVCRCWVRRCWVYRPRLRLRHGMEETWKREETSCWL
jgi:hypothetical protein